MYSASALALSAIGWSLSTGVRSWRNSDSCATPTLGAVSGASPYCLAGAWNPSYSGEPSRPGRLERVEAWWSRIAAGSREALGWYSKNLLECFKAEGVDLIPSFSGLSFPARLRQEGSTYRRRATELQKSKAGICRVWRGNQYARAVLVPTQS